MKKKAKGRERHQRRVARRAALRAGAAAAAVTASLCFPRLVQSTTLCFPRMEPRTVQTEVAKPALAVYVPRMVHTQSVKTSGHRTWDSLLNHISQQTVGMQTINRRHELDRWVYDLVKRPSEPQPALLLAGPDYSGKTTFHEAMGLLLPDQAVVKFPPFRQVGLERRWDVNREEWESMLNRCWLMVTEGHPERFCRVIANKHKRQGRYLKWCLTYNQTDADMPGVRFEMRLLTTTIPRTDLLKRLEDERDAFRQTLFRRAAAA